MNDNIEMNQIIEVDYVRPKFWARILANLVDILICAFMSFTLFLGTKEIVQSNNSYKKMALLIDDYNIASGLYIKNDNDEIVTYTSYIEGLTNINWPTKINRLKEQITFFINYIGEFDTNSLAEVNKSYDEVRLDLKGSDEGKHPYFIKDSSGLVIENTNSDGELYYTNAQYFEAFYEPFFKNYLSVYLFKYAPNYASTTKTMNNLIIFLEIPVGLFLGLVITYYIFPLIFRRGKQTVGSKMFHIGYVDYRYLSPTFWRETVKFLIFLLEVILSIFTFGIPLLISFTLMALSKKKQGFPDYMTGIEAVNTNKQKIYYDKVEILIDRAKTNKKPIDFKPIQKE